MKEKICASGTLNCICQKAEKKLKKFLDDQKSEIEKYKWELGIKLCHDPLQDKSINEICFEWINAHAAEFREQWETKYGKLTEDN